MHKTCLFGRMANRNYPIDGCITRCYIYVLGRRRSIRPHIACGDTEYEHLSLDDRHQASRNDDRYKVYCREEQSKTWSIAVDELLGELTNLGIHVQGYNYDTVLVMRTSS